jgi:hypothetical protein
MKSKGVSFRPAVELLREGEIDLPAAKCVFHAKVNSVSTGS